MADLLFAPATASDDWFPASTGLVLGGAPNDDGWYALVTERDGTVVCDLPGVKISEVSETLNTWPTAKLTVPKAHPNVGELHRLTREIQIYRDGGNPLFVGPIVQRTVNGSAGVVDVTCLGVGYYLSRRYGSDFSNGNLLINPRFDDGFMAWSNTGVTLDPIHETGTQSVEFSGVPGGELRQTVAQTVSGQATVMVEARVRVSSGATGSWRLFINVSGAPTSTFTTIDASGGVNEWRTVTATLDIDLSAPTVYIYTGIDTVGGTSMLVDRMACYLFAFGTTDIIEPDPLQLAADQTQVIREVVQDRNTGLNLGVNAAPTDQLVFYNPREDADRNGIEVINRYTKRENGVEWWVVATPTTRTFTTYFPRKGRDIPPEELVLRWQPGVDPETEPRNCTGYTLSEDGTEAATEVTTKGDSLFRGTAGDTAALGGLKLQTIQQAPAGTPREDLEGMSLRALRANEGDAEVLTLEVDDWAVFDVVELGDRVWVVIEDHTVVSIDGLYRVVNRVPAPGATFQLTLNPEPPEV